MSRNVYGFSGARPNSSFSLTLASCDTGLGHCAATQGPTPTCCRAKLMLDEKILIRICYTIICKPRMQQLGNLKRGLCRFQCGTPNPIPGYFGFLFAEVRFWTSLLFSSWKRHFCEHINQKVPRNLGQNPGPGPPSKVSVPKQWLVGTKLPSSPRTVRGGKLWLTFFPWGMDWNSWKFWGWNLSHYVLYVVFVGVYYFVLNRFFSWYFLTMTIPHKHQKHTKQHMGVSKNRGTPKWMVYMEHPIKMDDLGVPLFSETPTYTTNQRRFFQENTMEIGVSAPQLPASSPSIGLAV